LSGAYIPLETTGRRKAHIVAFARKRGTRTVIAAAARFFLKLDAAGELPSRDVWADTALLLPKSVQAGCYRDALTGQTVPATWSAGKVVAKAAEIFSSGLAVLLEPG
jgi:(1->4)-alpha-D-glucan 1-alpha-D-glucosylmutase